MRPRLFTLRNFILFTLAGGTFAALAFWISQGAPLPTPGVPSTAGKLVFVSDRDGAAHLYMAQPDQPATLVALTTGAGTDDAPTWNLNGSEVAYTSAETAGVPQVRLIDAQAGSRVRTLTSTSSTKGTPRFGGKSEREQLVYFLDSGKLASVDPRNNETDGVLPEADERKKLEGLFLSGGLDNAAISPDGKRVLAVLHLEHGSVLLLYSLEEHTVSLLGGGQHILFSFLADSSFAAAYQKGQPLAQQLPLVDKEQVQDPTFIIRDPIDATPGPKEILEQLFATTDNVLARYQADGTPVGALPLPFAPDGFAVTAKGDQAIFTNQNPKAFRPGVYVLSFEQGQIKQVFDKPATQLSLSPDGNRVAFVSGKDIFVVPVGGGTPANLTVGKGKNTNPVWSPAKEPEKK